MNIALRLPDTLVTLGLIAISWGFVWWLWVWRRSFWRKLQKPPPMDPVAYKAMLEERKVREKAWYRVVGSAVREVENSLLKGHPAFLKTELFGAMGVHPSYLAIWCFFKTEEDVRKAAADGFADQVTMAMREALSRHGYPPDLAATRKVSFGSDEEVQRDFKGNYWLFLR